MSEPVDEIDKSRAPLIEHLIELRKRLFVCVGSLVVAFGVGFYFARPILIILCRPYQIAQAIQAERAGQHASIDLLMVLFGLKHVDLGAGATAELISTAPMESFFALVKIAAFAAVILSFPVIAWQLYRFVAPGLYKKERNAFAPFLIAAPLLFVAGAALVYFIILPFLMWFSLTLQIDGPGLVTKLTPKVSDYLNMVTQLMLAFGLCFQLPVVLTLVGLAGLIEYKTLAKFRRYAILGIFVVAAIVTPPDPFTQFILALPLCLLYEASIWCV